jgi:hypothetical protein
MDGTIRSLPDGIKIESTVNGEVGIRIGNNPLCIFSYSPVENARLGYNCFEKFVEFDRAGKHHVIPFETAGNLATYYAELKL